MTSLIGFIGLGRMGYGMAARLRDKNYDLIVWNRTRSKAEEFSREYGALVASSPREVAEKANIIHLMVSDDNASRSVVIDMGLPGLRKPITLIEHSTITPQHSMFLEKLVTSQGGLYVEAPVIGGPRQARAGELILLVASSGSGSLPEEELKTLGDLLYLGEVPKASAVKLAFNNILLSLMAGLAESIALVEAYGVDYKVFLDKVLAKTFIKPFVERYGDRPFNKDFPASFRAKLAGKDAAYVAEALRHRGLPAVHSSSIASLYSLMESLGRGDSDYTHLVLTLLEFARKARS